MRIIDRPSADRATVESRLREFPIAIHTRFFAEMLPELWDAALRYAIDPVGMVAQSIKETAGGMFPRKAQPWMHNTCGLRVRYINQVQELLRADGVNDGEHPLTHEMFSSWQEGALAHAQHLRAYAGIPVPEHEVVDPRYVYVIGRHKVDHFEDLGGKWAGSPRYGQEIVDIAHMLQGVA